MKDENITIESYKLTFRHTISVNGKVIDIDEPKTMTVQTCRIGSQSIIGYQNNLVNELFMRMKEEVLREVEE